MSIVKGVEGTWYRIVKFCRNYLIYIYHPLTRSVTLCVVFYLAAILSSYSKDGGIAVAALPDNPTKIEINAADCPPYEAEKVSAFQSYLRLAQACQPPPQCAQDQRPCNIRHDENSCITWNCCEK